MSVFVKTVLIAVAVMAAAYLSSLIKASNAGIRGGGGETVPVRETTRAVLVRAYNSTHVLTESLYFVLIIMKNTYQR